MLTLSPQPVWRNFHSLTQIPRPSGEMRQICAYLYQFGQDLGLETTKDSIGNIIIKKPATPGMEDRPTVILQGHIDMVPQKNSHVVHDFAKDPIKTIIDGEWVKACETTLGADNGIGVASIMAILESKEFAHGPIEALFTVDEETGMYGAFALSPQALQGKILLNTDTETEGELCVGCAGGVNAYITLQYKENVVPKEDVAYQLSLKGLKGGHSGVDIHLGRGNANKLLFRLLKVLTSELDICLASFQGGTLHNAIPREAFAIFTLPPENVELLQEIVEEYQAIFTSEYYGIEDQIILSLEQVDLPSTIVPEEIQDCIIHAVNACPDGIARMIPTIPDIVETSDNLSVINLGNGEMKITMLIRSSNDTCKEALCSSIESAFAITGAKFSLEGDYSGWNPDIQSPILQTMKQEYKQLFGEEPKVSIIHAGLECGIIGSIIPGLDMVSFGPTIVHPHSPDEKVYIPSVEKYWTLLTRILQVIR